MFSGEAAESGGHHADWNKFFLRLTRVHQFKQLIQGTKKEVKHLEEASRLCWTLCSDDRARLQKRLDELNLNTLKQVSALKSQLSMISGQAGRSAASITEHSIEFYEPLQYLSDTSRELVLKIVEDRLQNAKEGPPDDGGEWKQRCEEAEERAQRAEDREANLRAAKLKLKQELDAAEERVEVLTAQVRSAMAQAAQLQAEKAALEEQNARLEEEKAELEERLAQQRERLAELERENARLEEERQRLEAELATFRERLEALQRELDAAKEQLERARREVERLEARVRELEERVAGLEAQLRRAQEEIEGLRARCRELEALAAAAEARARAAEAEAAELREELARRNDTVTRAGQTDLLGLHIDELTAENRKMKDMMSDTVTKLEQQGFGDFAKELSNDLGMSLLKAKTCFERLYDDALAREARLRRLQEEHAARLRSEVELRFTTWDQELEEGRQFESALQAEEARFKEHRSMHFPAPPLPVDVDTAPSLWQTSPRDKGNKDANSDPVTFWRLVPPPRMSSFGIRDTSPGLQSSAEGLSIAGEGHHLGAQTSLVLQPPLPRSYGRPRRDADRGPGGASPRLPPLPPLPPPRA